MNLIIIIVAGITAYVLAELFTIIDGLIAEWQLKQDEKKRLSNELYRFKLKQLYYYCQSYYISCGYNRQKANSMAIKAVHDMDNKFLVDEKYKLIKDAQRITNIRKIK